MESGMMKVIISSIINGSRSELPATEAICGSRETVVKTENEHRPEFFYSDKKQAADGYKEKTSREVFATLVNASNCANRHMDNKPDGYLTFAPGRNFFRKSR